MNLSENLKKIRKQHNLSQEQLAEKLGVSRQSVSKWESNQAYPEMDKMLQICQIFNLMVYFHSFNLHLTFVIMLRTQTKL